MTLSRAGGIAALICAATYVAGFTVIVTLLAPLGYGTERVDPAAVAALAHARPGVLIAFNTVIYILNALALIVLVVALQARIRPLLPGRGALATAIGLIWAGLVLAAGMIANVAVERSGHLYPQDPAAAADLWSVLHAVELGLGGGNEIAGAVWILCVSLSAGRISAIARPVVGLGVLTGIAGLATLVPPIGDAAGAIFGLGAILWFAAIGAALLGDGPRSQSAPRRPPSVPWRAARRIRLPAALHRPARRVLGALFLAAGIAKFLPLAEDPYATLTAAGMANSGHWLAPVTEIAIAHAPLLIPAIGLVMALTGAAQIIGKGVRTAGAVQLALMVCFVAILHRAFPAIFLIDGAIAAVVILSSLLPPRP